MRCLTATGHNDTLTTLADCLTCDCGLDGADLARTDGADLKQKYYSIYKLYWMIYTAAMRLIA